MSGGGKRSVAEWLKLPRPSSTLPLLPCQPRRAMSAIGGKPADVCDEIAPRQCEATNTSWWGICDKQTGNGQVCKMLQKSNFRNRAVVERAGVHYRPIVTGDPS